MRLPVQKKILKEDLKDSPSWVGPMIETMNNFMESVYQALNKNITFNQNIASFVKEITYNTPSTYPVMDEIEFLNELKTKAFGLQIIAAYERTTYIPAVGPVYVPWVEVNGSIIISPITGLEASKSYIIRMLII